MVLGIKALMARRAAEEIHSGDIVNLGIGMPTLVADYIPEGKHVMLHGENGILGIGPSPKKGMEQPLVTNAGGLPCSIGRNGSYFDSALSFALIRKGLIDLTILGTLEVAGNGDLANWIIPGKLVPGMGGGMELAQRSRKVLVLTSHVNKKGQPKIRSECTLPLTARKCVNLIVTDLAVMEVRPEGLILTEIYEHSSVDEVIEKTEAPLIVAESLRIIKNPEES